MTHDTLGMERIYLDYAATTPVDPRVLTAMRPYFSEKFGNPGSVHRAGQEAIAAIDEAREKVGKALGAKFREIIFTASATEANNLALRGLLRTVRGQYADKFWHKSASSQREVGVSPRVVVSVIEHESILETAKDLEKSGVEIIYLPVDKKGLVDLGKLKTALNERTVLVSVMYASNEVGTIQPIIEIAKIIADFKKNHYPLLTTHYPLLHADAVQALQYLNCDVNSLGVDMMTLSSHKIYGPKGAGALYVRRGGPATNHHPLATIISGGGQEYGLRSGTENVPAIVGFGKVAELLGEYTQEAHRVAELRDYFWVKLKKLKSKIEINGPGVMLKKDSSDLRRLPNNLNVYFPGATAEELLIKFDMAGIEASAGSACAARSLTPSYVIKELGFPEKRAKSSIRFSLGRPTTRQDLDEVLQRIKNLPA